MASINPYAEEKSHVLHVYDAPMAFQIHFCFTINEVYYGGKRLIFFRHSSFLNLAISATEHGQTLIKRFVLHRKEGIGAAVTPTQESPNSFQFYKDWKELERLLMTERHLGLAFFDGETSTLCIAKHMLPQALVHNGQQRRTGNVKHLAVLSPLQNPHFAHIPFSLC